MIPEFGLIALIMAFCFSIVQSVFPLLGGIFKQPGLVALGRQAIIGQFLFCLLSMLALSYAFINSDYSVLYVREHSDHSLPLFYRITALWGGHEGSLLLWVTMLNGWGAWVAWSSKKVDKNFMAKVYCTLGWVSCGFLLFLLMTSSPFAREFVNLPLSGRDLNPILQDPGLAIHPPMLYMGYVGFAIAFAFSIAILIEGKFPQYYASLLRPWVLGAWAFLTLGIILGSWWAYHELGWGGWWFWDPVENASLLPWLVGTALIHSVLACEKRGVFKSWIVLLGIISFALSLLGTFLVRSGVLISVHAFANDPTRGAYLLKYLAIVILSSLFIYAWRGPKLTSEATFEWLSRETFLLFNNLILLVMMATILIGTLYPMVLDGLGLGQISVGQPYFNAVFKPLAILLIGLMVLGPLCFWQSMSKNSLLKKASKSFIIAGVFAVVVMKLAFVKFYWMGFVGVFFAIWLLLSTVQSLFKGGRVQIKSKLSMVLAHTGVALCALGITFTSYNGLERDVRMSPQETMAVGKYDFTLQSTNAIEGANYSGAGVHFLVTKNDVPVTTLTGEKRVYTVSQMPLTHAAIKGGLFYDLYLALGSALKDGAWSVRIYYKPLIRWIWLGGLLMALGAIVAIMRRRRQPCD